MTPEEYVDGVPDHALFQLVIIIVIIAAALLALFWLLFFIASPDPAVIQAMHNTTELV
jgi:uncharacterized membrane protein YqiK